MPTQLKKLKLHGFNNLTKTLSFNIYDICYAESTESKDAYIKYIDETYSSQRLWNDFCSWYIELIKPDKADQEIREGSLNVAAYVLNQILKLMHPFTPFVTENTYRDLHTMIEGSAKSIMFAKWPETDSSFIDEKLEESLEQIQAVVTAVRMVRSELNVPPSKKSDLYIKVKDEAFAKLLENHIGYFRSLIKVENLFVGTDTKKPLVSASAIISGADIYVPLEGLIDIEVEKTRLEKELTNLKNQLEKVSRKLANPDFLANAPEEVAKKERAKKEDYQERIEKMNKNLEQILGW